VLTLWLKGFTHSENAGTEFSSGVFLFSNLMAFHLQWFSPETILCHLKLHQRILERNGLKATSGKSVCFLNPLM